MKRALIAGGSGAIGGAITAALLRDGTACVVADVKPPDSAAASAAPDLLTYLPLDLADPEQIRNVPEQLRRLGLEPDYAVFCASVLSLDTFERFPRDKWLRMFQINLIGTLDLCQALLPFMRDGGRIVFLTSAVMFKGLERYGPYAATKAALAAFARCLAKELGPRRITVNTVAPGFILTPPDRGSGGAGRPAGARPCHPAQSRPRECCRNGPVPAKR